MSRKIHTCCSERAKHMTGCLDLRESVELIDSRIPQRQHSQEKHEADSSPLSLGFGLIKTSKWVNNIIWLEIFSFRKEIIIFNFLVSSCCVNISETVKCMWFCMQIRNSFYYKAFYMTPSIHASKEILTQQADVAFTCLLASEGPFWRAHADKVLNPFTTWAPGISLVIKQQSFASCSYIFLGDSTHMVHEISQYFILLHYCPSFLLPLQIFSIGLGVHILLEVVADIHQNLPIN